VTTSHRRKRSEPRSAVAGGASFGSQQSADPEWATIPTLEITPRSNLDKLSRVLKTHCINNHRVG